MTFFFACRAKDYTFSLLIVGYMLSDKIKDKRALKARTVLHVVIIIIIIFFISSTCEEHTNKAQLHKQERNNEHINIIYIIGLVLIF